MRRSVRRAGEEAGVDMTPMLDIVFILLIFFIVAAVFLDERGIKLSSAPDAPPAPAAAPAILVQLDSNDQAFVDGARIDVASVPSRVQAMRADVPQASVILQADARSSVAAVVALKDDFDRATVPMTLKVQRDATVSR